MPESHEAALTTMKMCQIHVIGEQKRRNNSKRIPPTLERRSFFEYNRFVRKVTDMKDTRVDIYHGVTPIKVKPYEHNVKYYETDQMGNCASLQLYPLEGRGTHGLDGSDGLQL